MKRCKDADPDAYNALLYAMVITKRTDEAFAQVSRMLAQGTRVATDHPVDRLGWETVQSQSLR